MNGGDLPAEQVIEETTSGGASKVGGDLGGNEGGDCVAIGGVGGSDQGAGENSGKGAAEKTLANYNGGLNPVSYLGDGGGYLGSTAGGSWGQGQRFGRGLGQVVSSPAAPVVHDWNYFLNSVVNYSFWNGYPFPNYGLVTGTNLGRPQSGPPPADQAEGTGGATGGGGGGRRRGRSEVGKVGEKYSRKVFIGGLPPDIDEIEIIESFQNFGPVVVDWPRKSQSTAYFPPKGYAFLLFQREDSVKQLIDGCVRGQGHRRGQGYKNDNLFYFLDSPTIKAKAVQVRPWRLADANFWVRMKVGVDAGAEDLKKKTSEILDEGRLAFVGGVPRPLTAVELARFMDNIFGEVCYAGINCDKAFKYPKGCGRVGFSTKEAYEAAVGQRFVWFRYGNGYKQVEVKPFDGTMLRMD